MTRLCVPLALFLALAAPAFAGECRIPGVSPAAYADYGKLHRAMERAGYSPVSMRPECIVAKVGDGCFFTWRTPAGKSFQISVPFDHRPPMVADYPCPFTR